jgi:hypothetical protein
MNNLLLRLRSDFPQLKFTAGTRFFWSPAGREIVYAENASGPRAIFSLLHETGHALLEHQRYTLDFELLELEVAAWKHAKKLATDYGIDIDEDHIQDCLDTYRDWLYRRSICPSCTTKALQQDDSPRYQCFNCQASWSVSPSRFCRPYRKSQLATV